MARVVSMVFTWRSAIALSGLPRTTRAVAWALANYMNERGESAFPSVETLCGDVGNERGDGPASKSTVIAALRALAEAGWLERTKKGGGRGRRGEWHARIPETVQQLNRKSVSEDVASGADRDAGRTAPDGSGRDLSGAPGERERVQLPNRFREVETVQLVEERVQLRGPNGAAVAPEVERTCQDQAAAADEAGERAAAALLDHHLVELGIGARVRRVARRDRARAQAWLELAIAEATTNVAGFFRAGLDSGEWPSPRQAASTPDASRREWVESTSWLLEPDDAHAIVDDWRDIDDVERQEHHERVDAVRDERRRASEAA